MGKYWDRPPTRTPRFTFRGWSGPAGSSLGGAPAPLPCHERISGRQGTLRASLEAQTLDGSRRRLPRGDRDRDRRGDLRVRRAARRRRRLRHRRSHRRTALRYDCGFVRRLGIARSGPGTLRDIAPVVGTRRGRGARTGRLRNARRGSTRLTGSLSLDLGSATPVGVSPRPRPSGTPARRTRTRPTRGGRRGSPGSRRRRRTARS